MLFQVNVLIFSLPFFLSIENMLKKQAASILGHVHPVHTMFQHLYMRAGYRWAYDVIRPRGPSYLPIIAPLSTTWG